MICPKCKHEVVQNAKFCTRCGTKIEQVAEAPVQVEEVAAPKQTISKKKQPKSKKPRKERKISIGFLAVLIFMVVLAGCTMGGYFIFLSMEYGIRPVEMLKTLNEEGKDNSEKRQDRQEQDSGEQVRDKVEKEIVSEETADVPDVETYGNLIPGGLFDEENSCWGLYTESGGTATMDISNGELVISIENTGDVAYSVQAYCDGFQLLQGGKYILSFDMYSTEKRMFECYVQVNGGDYHPYAGGFADLSNAGMESYSMEFNMEEPTDLAPRLCFNIGRPQNGESLPTHKIYIDNVRLILLEKP